MRLAAKRDTVEKPLVALAEELGARWIQFGPLDGWCWSAKHGFVPVEIKSPRGTLTWSQMKFVRQCTLDGAKYWIWRTPEDVLESLGARQSA